MSKYLMYHSEMDSVRKEVGVQRDALDDLIGELNNAIAMTYVASGFGVDAIRSNLRTQKSEIKTQMENLKLIQQALYEINEFTEDSERRARNEIWKAIIIEKITDYYDYNGDGTLSWNDSLDFLDDILSYFSSICTISELIQILGDPDLGELNAFLKDFGPYLKIASILLDLAEGDFLGGAETAVKWLAKVVLNAATGISGFGPAFLISWAWNAGEAISENISDYQNGEGVFADGVDVSDIFVIAGDVVIDSAGETVWDIAHGVVQGVSVVASWITGGETYDEVFPEAATYEGFKDQTLELGSMITSEWLS